MGSVTQQLIDNPGGAVDGKKVITDAATAGSVALIAPGVRVPGITSGRNSFSAVAKAADTKLTNGTIESVSSSTAAKATTAVIVEGSGAAALESAASKIEVD